MLVVERNKYQYSWSLHDAVKPLNYRGETVIVFDPSKTNMAVIIGTPTGEVLNQFEFSGNNRRRGPTMDTTQYCLEVRTFLERYLGTCSIYLAATEATIEKKGASYYKSNLVLTEIRASILGFFKEKYNIDCIEVNNWTWKHAILPEGYRSQKEKGSKRFLAEHFPGLGVHTYFEADMSDAVCIYWYCVQTLCKSYSLLCNRIEHCTFEYEYTIVPTDTLAGYTDMSVTYNDRFSVADNLAYYVNRIRIPFGMDVPVTVITQDEVYGHARLFCLHNISDREVRVVARRCSY